MRQFERVNPRISSFVDIYLATHLFSLTLPSNPTRRKVVKESS